VTAPEGPTWPQRVGAFALDYSTSAHASQRADNDHSIVVRVSFGNTGVLLTGDIGAAGVQRVVQSGVADGVDVMFLPHHGMSCPGLPRLVRRVRPRLLVLSGERPRTIRTAPDPALLRTYDHGALFLAEDGRELVAWSFAQGRELARLPP
jgi:competence protein ComEC